MCIYCFKINVKYVTLKFTPISTQKVLTKIFSYIRVVVNEKVFLNKKSSVRFQSDNLLNFYFITDLLMKRELKLKLPFSSDS